MKIDAHVHFLGKETNPEEYIEKLHLAGFDMSTVFSMAPNGMLGEHVRNEKRLEDLLAFTEGHQELLPFYFFDPTEKDAIAQIEKAKDAGVVGYKIICNHFFPSDERAMEVYKWIAEHNMPLMFHSGILYDGINVSGKYNRPCEFEPLLSIKGLRFSIAHLSWPWVDECVAVFGKFHAFLSNHDAAEAAKMYLDLTPGTPPTYREGALTHVFGNGFDVEKVAFWGSDNGVGSYNHDYARKIYDRDVEIFQKLGTDEKVMEDIFFNNFMEFIGKKK